MFRKSSLCREYWWDDNCVEVESSQCPSGKCVEVSQEDGVFAVRDSKDPDGPHLHFTCEEWKAFIEGVKLGEFDYNL